MKCPPRWVLCLFAVCSTLSHAGVIIDAGQPDRQDFSLGSEHAFITEAPAEAAHAVTLRGSVVPIIDRDFTTDALPRGLLKLSGVLVPAAALSAANDSSAEEPEPATRSQTGPRVSVLSILAALLLVSAAVLRYVISALRRMRDTATDVNLDGTRRA